MLGAGAEPETGFPDFGKRLRAYYWQRRTLRSGSGHHIRPRDSPISPSPEFPDWALAAEQKNALRGDDTNISMLALQLDGLMFVWGSRLGASSGAGATAPLEPEPESEPLRSGSTSLHAGIRSSLFSCPNACPANAMHKTDPFFALVRDL